MTKAVHFECKKRYDNKYMVWGLYPIHEVEGMDKPYTRKFPVYVQLLAAVEDTQGKARAFMKRNLKRPPYIRRKT